MWNQAKTSTLVSLGTILTRHILDALPSASQVPKTQEGSRAIPVVNSKLQKSRRVGWEYLISQPFLRIFTKSPTAAIQSILHILFLPTPFKLLSESTFVSSKSNSITPSASTSNADGAPKKTTSLLDDLPEEVLAPGALYADCAVVVNLTVKSDNPDIQRQVNDKVKSEAETSSTNKEKRRGEVIELPDDGEYGGELAGRLVWEAYEAGLKVWERENPRPVEEEGGHGVGDRKEESGGRNTGKRTQRNEEHEHEKDVYL